MLSSMMPRRARLAIPGIPWHIIQRGNNRTACFYAEEDDLRYLVTLREMAKKFDCAVHASVLMTNHVHLLLTPSQKESAGLLMKHVGQRYVQYVNPLLRPKRDPLGGPISILLGAERTLCPGVLPLYRAQPGAGEHGFAPAGLSVVKLPRQRRRQFRSVAHSAPGVPTPGADGRPAGRGPRC